MQQVWHWLRLIPGLALLVGVSWGAWRLLGHPAHHPPEMEETVPSENLPSTVAAAPLTTEERARIGCEATSRRVALGGSVGPLDADGWAIELWLIGKEASLSASSPALASFFPSQGSTRRLLFPEETQLAARPELDANVTIEPLPLASYPPFLGAGVIITLGSGYAPAYFDESSRQAFHRLASALFDATSARYAGLFARCATEDRHQIGSWFRGPNPEGLVAIVVGSMGLGLPAPHLRELSLESSASAQGRALTTLTRRWARTTKRDLGLFTAEEGVMLAERKGSFLTMSFPFGDANRATRVSTLLCGWN
jgi:hypothetical protein